MPASAGVVVRLLLVVIGRLKDGGERVLVDRYIGRLAAGRGQSLGPIAEKELAESRLGSVFERQSEEARRLLQSADGCQRLVALDEHGKTQSSHAFAQWLGQQRDAGIRDIGFLIGGADGHGSAVRERADLLLSLGPMTLPHGLARAVLAEQLYRASTILSGHPYHRA
ncbi:MAG: 23S rRNA (pseudouridine(1915)-N(3))-methyltransferase RlmH [Hyphomicrobiaceae bacterium]